MATLNRTAPPIGNETSPSSALNVTMATVVEEALNRTSDTAAIERFVWIAEAFIQPTILSVGILTNSLSVLVLGKVKMNYVFRTCLLALAASDLCACAVGLVAMLMEVTIFGGEMPFGDWHPAAVVTFALFYAYMMFICTSAALVILIALIRNAYIVSPIGARRHLTGRNTRLACLLTFLLTFAIFAPTALNVVYQSCFDDRDTPICEAAFRKMPNLEEISSRYLFAVSALFGPVLIVLYAACFVSIRLTVGRSVDALSAMTPTTADKDGRRGSARMRGKAASRVTRTLLVILVLDVICTLPSVVQAVGLLVAPTATVFDKTNRNYDVFDVIAEIFLNFRPMYNFWLYVFHHPEFRARLRVLCLRAANLRMRGYGYDVSTSSSLEYRTEVTYVRREPSENGRSSITLVTKFSK